MSGGPLRKVPRIISRKVKQDKNIENDQVPSSSNDALTNELSKEKVVVKDGCLVAVQHIEKGTVHGILGGGSSHGTRRIIIDTVPSDHTIEPYTENPLPGVADEVESYPCKFCSEQVFLTSYGLERHARQNHRDCFNEIMEDIQNIKGEWERRERERHRLRERAMLARARQESIAMAAIRSATERITGSSSDRSGEIVLPTNAPERFEACRICNILVNIKHPTAMENHLGAHRKNDQLRNHLLSEYGLDVVRKLTCHECRLVFTDPTKLDAHMDSSHVRRRKFVCKYCGHLCLSMTDLNSHKADVHAITHGSNAAAARAAHLMAMKNNQLQQEAAAAASTARDMSPERQFGRNFRGGMEESFCSTSCSECGLRLVRPSLLVRHMLRVHSKDTFSCEVVTRGVPSIRIEVEQNRLAWWCCDTKYLDRNEFLYHRRSVHLEQLMGQHKYDGQGSNDKILQMATAHLPMEPGSSTFSGQLVEGDDGTMRVMLPDGVDTSGELYVVMMNDDEEGKVSYTEMPGVHHQEEEEEEETVQISVEQYEQLRQQYGDEINNMQIMFVNDSVEATEGLMDDPTMVERNDKDLSEHMEPELTNEEIFEP